MIFSSNIFLFGFFPVVFLFYYLMQGHRKGQNVFLCISSLLFYAWGEPVFVLVMLASIGINWWCALRIDKKRQTSAAKAALVTAIAVDLLLLFVFKYLSFVQKSWYVLTESTKESISIVLPIGISFFTFQSISYVVDVYRNKGAAQSSPLYVALYIAFFPQLIAGPIVRYETIAEQIQKRKESWSGIALGIRRFMTGLVKKVLMADHAGQIADMIFGTHEAGHVMPFYVFWLGALCYAMQIYLDFSGYSDMAIGLGQMFGFQFEENFNKPYHAGSITEFWRKWHISLSTWFRDYLYIPLGGNRVSKSRHVFNLFIVWLATGIWHGANWTFLCWGLYYFVLLMIEKYSPFMQKHVMKHWIGHVYTLFFVLLGWVLFRAQTLSLAWNYILNMFCVSAAGVSAELITAFTENWIYLLFAALYILLEGKLQRRPARPIWGRLKAVLLFAGFLLSIAEIFNSTYSPFIYFNF